MTVKVVIPTTSQKCSESKGDVGHNSGNSDAGSNNKW